MKNKLLGLMFFSIIGCSAVQSAFAEIVTGKAVDITWGVSSPSRAPWRSTYEKAHICLRLCYQNCIEVSRDSGSKPVELLWNMDTEKRKVSCSCTLPDGQSYGEHFDIGTNSNGKCFHRKHGEGYEDRMRSVDATPPPLKKPR